MSETQNHLGGFQLLRPKPGLCEACAVQHEPNMPHNQQSLHWQYWFFQRNGRWPTWEDALTHCDGKMYGFWQSELAKKGITVKDREPVTT